LVLPFCFFTEGVARAHALVDGKRGAPNALDSMFATVRQLHDPIEGLASGETRIFAADLFSFDC